MKTAKEILFANLLFKFEGIPTEARELLYDAIYKSMEEYAQQKQGYPAEFIEWIGFESPHRLYYQEITDKWFYATEFTNHKVYTFDELYEYWKINVKDK